MRARIEEGPPADVLGEYLGPDVLLVPAPKSSPLVRGALWIPREICRALVDVGLGMGYEALLERVTPVPKSSRAKTWMDRPTPDVHANSMSVIESQRLLSEDLQRITVVDDVITRGSTTLASVSLLKEVYPNAEVRAFACVRTLSGVHHLESIFDPCSGEIVLGSDGYTTRTP
jgi:hypothetical protein